jgi:hypothetical protein
MRIDVLLHMFVYVWCICLFLCGAYVCLRVGAYPGVLVGAYVGFFFFRHMHFLTVYSQFEEQVLVLAFFYFDF